jgi:hypothetical protein
MIRTSKRSLISTRDHLSPTPRRPRLAAGPVAERAPLGAGRAAARPGLPFARTFNEKIRSINLRAVVSLKSESLSSKRVPLRQHTSSGNRVSVDQPGIDQQNCEAGGHLLLRRARRPTLFNAILMRWIAMA